MANPLPECRPGPGLASGKISIIKSITCAMAGREGSNLRMAESKSARILSSINVGSELQAISAANQIKRLLGNSECFGKGNGLISLRQISREIAAAGHTTPKGLPNSASAVSTMIQGRQIHDSMPESGPPKCAGPGQALIPGCGSDSSGYSRLSSPGNSTLVARRSWY